MTYNEWSEKGYPKVKYPDWEGWIPPSREGFKFKCCTCGLVHKIRFKTTKNPNGPGRKIWMSVERDNRSTAAGKRAKKVKP